MQLRELTYQQRVLKLLDEYLAELSVQKQKAHKIERANADETDLDLRRPAHNFPQATWRALTEKGLLPLSRRAIPYSERLDGASRAVPNIVYKVPTAGGKTFLAVASLAKILNQYLGKSTGFVLWITPNEAIYTQTKKQFSDRRHPYRQLLDNLSGNAVKLLEKNSTLSAADVESNLCVMLLMLQSSNRQNKESLKMFQERGDVHGFTPEEGNQQAHQVAKAEIPNLDVCDLIGANYPWLPIKDSLGNALRMIRPLVVMDEGHKAVSDLAFKTLYGFNPSFVLELTATPKDVKERSGKNSRAARYQNLLVEVSGTELDQEGMIKLPLNLDSRQSTDWKITLQSALKQLNDLDREAKCLHANQGRYIRPIMLVQVERTGSDQHDGRHIHAEDVRQWVTTVGRLDGAEVAIKTADINDLKSPENQDLLSEKNRIRVIITKQALQEGWDCPFAYVLCSLAASSSLSAMTQLVGRILRQPQAMKTAVAALDQCYVVSHHAKTNHVVDAIKDGLEKGGMGDLVQSIAIGNGGGEINDKTKINRNPKFANRQIFLPKVLYVADDEQRELDYAQDILYALDWHNLTVDELVATIPTDYKVPERQLQQIWLKTRGSKSHIDDSKVGSPAEQRVFDCAYSTQFITDIVPNAWLARALLEKVVAGLKQRKFSDEKLGKFASLINEELRKWLHTKRDEMAETLFKKKVNAGQIQFRLQTSASTKELNWKIPLTSPTEQIGGAKQLPKNDGQPMQKSLFLPVYADEMNEDERKIAAYMDDVETLNWWHRNIARNHYYLQGWRRDKIYPDFVCSVQTDTAGKEKLVVLEMKGEHLAGNEDTQYKQAVLKLMTESFSAKHANYIGEADLVGADGTSMHCELVMLSNWKTKLGELLQAS